MPGVTLALCPVSVHVLVVLVCVDSATIRTYNRAHVGHNANHLLIVHAQSLYHRRARDLQFDAQHGMDTKTDEDIAKQRLAQCVEQTIRPGWRLRTLVFHYNHFSCTD